MVNNQPWRERSLLNKAGHAVRERAPGAGDRAADRRVRRTQRALTVALLELVSDKGYDAVTIQDLLNRADVGRSTFYAHYRGKDDLLLRSFERMLDGLDDAMEQQGEANRRLAPVRELFRHVAASRTFHRALARARMLDRVYQAGTNRLGATITRRLAALPRRTGGAAGDAPELAVVAQACAGALFALLRWWVDQGAPFGPERMDEMYHAIVGAGVGPAPGDR
jgi:AcrR family transcriptional regulator